MHGAIDEFKANFKNSLKIFFILVFLIQCYLGYKTLLYINIIIHKGR